MVCELEEKSSPTYRSMPHFVTFDELDSRPNTTVFTDELTNFQASQSPNVGTDSLHNSESLEPKPSEMLPSERRSIVLEDRDTIDGDLDVNDTAMEHKVGGFAGPGATSYMRGIIEAPAEMPSFGEPPNHGLEIGGTAGPDATNF